MEWGPLTPQSLLDRLHQHQCPHLVYPSLACRNYFHRESLVIFLVFVYYWALCKKFQNYYNHCKCSLSRGQKKVLFDKRKEASEVLYHTSRVSEVGLESSFQPTIQLYLLLPTLVGNLTNTCKNQTKFFPGIWLDHSVTQIMSVVTSVLSLALRFTSHQMAMKRGALDSQAFTRAILFSSILLSVISRLVMFVLFAYSFGPGIYYVSNLQAVTYFLAYLFLYWPGNFFPLITTLAIHVMLMSGLHIIFSDALSILEKKNNKGAISSFMSFFHHTCGNGFNNIYMHNWIGMEDSLTSEEYSSPWLKLRFGFVCTQYFLNKR